MLYNTSTNAIYQVNPICYHVHHTGSIFRTESKEYLSPNIKPGSTFGKKGIVMNIHFLLCGSCFWCASQSNNCNTRDMITECPSCNDTRVESLPISHDEVYRFGYNPKRGVTLEFSN